MYSRWSMLITVTPSGKQQYVCQICGRVSCFPDKSCPGTLVRLYGKDGATSSCEQLEKTFQTHSDHTYWVVK